MRVWREVFAGATPQWLRRAVLVCGLLFASSALAVDAAQKFDHFTTSFPLLGAHASAPCESCHLRSIFKGTPRLCAGCHNGVIAEGKGADHVRTNAACDVCHSPRSVTFDIAGGFDHAGITSGCATCHQKDRTANHIPTPPGSDCSLCHRVPPDLFSTAAVFNHSNVTNMRCDACHSGAFKAAGAEGKTANHPRTAPGEDCHSCHDTATFAGARFDHTGVTTGCNTCHVKDRPANHVPTPAGAECVLCHRVSPETWAQAALFNHSNVTSLRCDACHSGAFSASGAPGKTPDHPPTTPGQDCGDCHGTSTFAGAAFDHAGVTTGCARCHTSDLPANHLPRPPGSECVLCHRVPPPDTFANAATFNHAFLSAMRCDACHNGSYLGAGAQGRDAQHIPVPNGQDCHICHRIPPDGFVVAVNFNHNLVTSMRCSQCHSGQFANAGAEGKGPGHFVTTAECDRCHTTAPGWASTVATFRHQTANYPGDHNPGVTCASCHTTNSEVATWSNAALKPFCGGCHDRDYDPGPHDKTITPATQYNVTELKDCSGACHIYATPGGAISRTRNGPEHRVNGAAF